MSAPRAEPGPKSPIEIESILRPGAVLHSLRAMNRDQALKAIGARAEIVYGLDASQVASGLLSREHLAPTAMGGGIAIPHARLPDLCAPIGLFARIAPPVDFAAPDGQGVDLVFAFFSPTDQDTLHLRTLARIARLMRDTALCGKLRASSSMQALHALLTEPALAAA